MTMTLIETKTLGTAAAAIEFTAIDQTGTDLLLQMSLRSTIEQSAAVLEFNSSTTGFSFRYLLGSGSGSPSSGLLARYAGSLPSNSWTANTFSNSGLYILNYSGSTNKPYSLDDVTENNATLSYQIIGGGVWADTAAITSIKISGATGNLAIGSTISLYKITKGSSGGVTVS